MSNVLITGASGFIGANIVRNLIYTKDQIHIIQNRILGAVHATWKIMKRKEQVFQLLVDNAHNAMTFQL